MHEPPSRRRVFQQWLRRRVARDEALGLTLTVVVLLWCATLCLFALLAIEVLRQGRLTAFDERFGLKLRDFRQNEPLSRAFFRAFTNVGGVPAMIAFAVLVGLALFGLRKRWLALLWIVAMSGEVLLNIGLKHFIDRDRPEFRDATIDEQTKSFPSGHSMGSIVGFGLLAYLLVLTLPRRWARRLVVALAVLILLIGFSRMYLGAHYFSDVLGGFSIGACWLILMISLSEFIRRRPPRQKSAAAEAGASGPRAS